MRIRYLPLYLLLLVTGMARAQDHTIVDVSGGMGLSYAAARGEGTKYSSLYLPHASICVIIPIEGWFFLRTGLAYQQKGFETHMNAVDTAAYESDITSKQKLHYISTPLQLCYRAPISSRSEYFISAGMDYGFLVRADSRLDINTYDNGLLLHNQVTTYHPRVGLLPKTTPFNAKDGVEYLLFCPSVRIDASFFWEKQYSLGAFWSYDMANVSANPGTNITRLASWGLSIGVLLR